MRNFGQSDLADRIWRDARSGDITVRMAYYGGLFLDPGAQGAVGSVDLDPESQDLVEQLAAAWLENAATYADPRDQAEARRELNELTADQIGAQGPRRILRPAMNGLSGLRWFAPLGIGLAGRFVDRALTQVVRYLRDDTIRTDAQDRVLTHIGDDTRLVIGHSLGSVVAYEALHRSHQPVALLTLGSPLGLRSIVYDRLRPQPHHVPRAVTRWDNLVDRDDLVAAHLNLAPYFPAAPGATVIPVTPAWLDNGAKPHEATHYLTKRTTGRIISEVLQT